MVGLLIITMVRILSGVVFRPLLREARINADDIIGAGRAWGEWLLERRVERKLTRKCHRARYHHRSIGSSGGAGTHWGVP